MTPRDNFNIKFGYGSEIDKDAIPDQLHEDIRGTLEVGEKEDIPELEHTPEQAQCIRDMNNAASVVWKRLGLDFVSVPDERIHIISPDVFAADPDNIMSGGYVFRGHIYIEETHPIRFPWILSHELVHTGSFTEKHVVLDTAQTDSEDSVGLYVHALQTRSGYHIKKETNEKEFGVGFSEAMTELVADQVRSEFAEQAGYSDDMTEEFMTQESYEPQKILLYHLFEAMNPNDPGSVYMTAVRDYLHGGSTMFKQFTKYFREQGNPRGLKILMEMGDTPESARATAIALGLCAATEEIERFIEQDLHYAQSGHDMTE